MTAPDYCIASYLAFLSRVGRPQRRTTPHDIRTHGMGARHAPPGPCNWRAATAPVTSTLPVTSTWRAACRPPVTSMDGSEPGFPSRSATWKLPLSALRAPSGCFPDAAAGGAPRRAAIGPPRRRIAVPQPRTARHTFIASIQGLVGRTMPRPVADRPAGGGRGGEGDLWVVGCENRVAAERSPTQFLARRHEHGRRSGMDSAPSCHRLCGGGAPRWPWKTPGSSSVRLVRASGRIAPPTFISMFFAGRALFPILPGFSTPLPSLPRAIVVIAPELQYPAHQP